MQLRSTFFRALLLIISIGSFSQSFAQGVKAKGTAYYENIKLLKTDAYQISYPASWKVGTSKTWGNDTEFILYFSSDPSDGKYNGNLNLIIKAIKEENLDLNSLTAQAIKAHSDFIPGFKVVLNEQVKSGSHTFQRLIFQSAGTPIDFRFEQRYWIIGNLTYVLTATYFLQEAAYIEPVIYSVLNTFKPLM